MAVPAAAPLAGFREKMKLATDKARRVGALLSQLEAKMTWIETQYGVKPAAGKSGTPEASPAKSLSSSTDDETGAGKGGEESAD